MSSNNVLLKASVLVVEDDPALREALVDTLEIAGCEVLQADSAEAALTLLLESSVDMVVSDINMGAMDGLGLLKEIRRQYPQLPVLLITAYGSVTASVEAIRNGAVDYLVKPFAPALLVEAVSRHVGVASPCEDDQPVAVEPSSQQLLQLAQRVAKTDSTVLICGESGTGKEVLARYIHQYSPRAKAPFVAINCAAIPENMLEGMLFGHEKGAFTGAVSARNGLIEAADGGTLFLDEIGELPLEAQARLLRVLQEGEIRRVGSTVSKQVNVRLIAATHRNLKALARTGQFREDLYYRLNVVQLRLPPLRERGDDILGLANTLLAKACKKLGQEDIKFSPEAMKSIRDYQWPGNVRELENAIERGTILCDNKMITPDLLDIESEVDDMNIPQGLITPSQNHMAFTKQVKKNLSIEDYFQQFVLENQDRMNETELAKRLGISRKNLWERRQRLGIPRKKSNQDS